MEVRMGDCIESMQLAFPYPTIEPLIQHLAENLDEEEGPARPRQVQASLTPRLAEIPLSFTAQWPALRMVAREIAVLKVGDVVPIPSDMAKCVQLRLANVPLFHGRLGTQGNNWAIEITRVRKPQS
jgi:flagellar motor switch protein FliM